jgi:hypothetical protein
MIKTGLLLVILAVIAGIVWLLRSSRRRKPHTRTPAAADHPP